jgi:hypothetical protein
MAVYPFTAVAHVLTAISLAMVGVSHAAPMITVPVRVHIVRDLVMAKEAFAMRSWVTDQQVRDVIVPEVNRIWRAADVAFRLDATGDVATRRPPDYRERIDAVVTARRDADGESDPERIRHLGELIAFAPGAKGTVDVYLVPYLGEASQGNAKRSLRRVFAAQWTDKGSKGRGLPERFPLTERGAFVRGSLSRTVAHELGHVLGLRHPDKRGAVAGLLMGGRMPGEALTAEEVAKARRKAARLARREDDDTD